MIKTFTTTFPSLLDESFPAKVQTCRNQLNVPLQGIINKQTYTTVFRGLLDESLPAEVQACRNQLNVPLLQRKVYHSFIFFHLKINITRHYYGPHDKMYYHFYVLVTEA